MTHSVQKLSCPINRIDHFAQTNTHHIQWKEALFEQYDKNASYQVFPKLVPFSDLPPNVDILCSELAPSIKPTNIPSIWKLDLRHYLNGKPLKGSDFQTRFFKKIFCYFPPYCITWWNSQFPMTPINPSYGLFVLQSSQNIQGTPHAANCWQKNLHQHLVKIRYINNDVDTAF